MIPLRLLWPLENLRCRKNSWRMSGDSKASSVFKLLMRALLLEIIRCFVPNSDKSVIAVGSWIMWDYGGINPSWPSIPFYHYLLLLISSIYLLCLDIYHSSVMPWAAGLCGINPSWPSIPFIIFHVLLLLIIYNVQIFINYQLWAAWLCGIMVGLIPLGPRFQLSDFDLMTKQGNFKIMRGERLRQN